ncbi:VTT domain-containing protein [Ferviditalea candida]|uniref:VTT domain-containing protein n=1 Tax=Ferviditalea candida TaxID=3108399 RepID=A0ABU5ZEI2_9BACL|nr:VTT domain-containing protein [Paenibacillaceae bacterium T2]
MLNLIMNWIDQHGYTVLFFVPMLELLFLPVSAEVVMGYGGVLVYQEKLNWLASILIAGVGSSIGMTLAYWIGYKLGTPFFEKYGSRIHMGPERLEKMSQWFQKSGYKVIMINYFITGVRHLTGYFSGITGISFRVYMLYAYSGALIWASVFVSLGKLFGPQWEKYHNSIKRYLLIGTIFIALLFILFYLYKKYKLPLMDWTVKALKRGERILHSARKVEMLVVVWFLVLVSLFALMVGLIQDLLANEFTQFDDVSAFLVHALFDDKWSIWMSFFALLSSWKLLGSIAVLTFLWILIKGKDRMLESVFLIIVILGGELWEEGLRRLFQRVGPAPANLNVPYTFPGEPTFMMLIVFGFAAFLLIRHHGSKWIRYLSPLLTIILSILGGLSLIYFGKLYPSDAAAGYVFGGFWLYLNIVTMEIFRLFAKKA